MFIKTVALPADKVFAHQIGFVDNVDKFTLVVMP